MYAYSGVFEEKVAAALKIKILIGIQGYRADEDSYSNDPEKGAKENAKEVEKFNEEDGLSSANKESNKTTTQRKGILKESKPDK